MQTFLVICTWQILNFLYFYASVFSNIAKLMQRTPLPSLDDKCSKVVLQIALPWLK
jgi:hypothetical protein